MTKWDYVKKWLGENMIAIVCVLLMLTIIYALWLFFTIIPRLEEATAAAERSARNWEANANMCAALNQELAAAIREREQGQLKLPEPPPVSPPPTLREKLKKRLKGT